MTKDSAANKGFSLPFARVALILAALIAVAAVAVAVLRGREGGESAPAAAPTQPVGDIASMIGGLEKKLAQNPDDPKGWHLLGLAYYNVARYPDALKAFTRATELEPANAEHWSALGEVQLLTGPGGVTPVSEASFRKALALNPKDFRARYFMAVKKNEDGDHKGAIDDLVDVVKESPPEAPWVEPVRELISRIASENKIDIAGRLPAPAPSMASAHPPGDDVATAGIPGPTSADLKAATSMTPAQQDEMARGMVERLAVRLRDNPKDADRWIMLMRARMVLNDAPGAKTALSQAKAAFQGDPAQQGRFDDAARALGISR